MKQLFFLLIFLNIGNALLGQTSETNSDSLRKDALNVYMSANDYIKREIPFINYVRDLNDAQVYIISTGQQTGSGGAEYTYFLVGQNEFAGMNDTVSAVTSPDDTQDQIRAKQVSVLKMSLMRYVLKTPLSKYIDIRFTQPLKEEVTTDKWDSWVFTTGIDAYLNGQSTIKSQDISGSFSASRVTKDWKLVFEMYYFDEKEKFDLGTTTFNSKRNSASFDGMVVKSINDHWSVGGSVDINNSSYSNYDLAISALPGIEFNIFPYSESTRRQFSFLYSIGYKYHNYRDTSIYNKTAEDLWMHSLKGTYSVIQKWGSVSISAIYRNYLHDFSLNYLALSGQLRFRITKGLSLNLYGSTSLIHDQIALPKGGATEAEILTRQRELKTNYSYYTSVGLSYTFGSIYNNVVNPRFR